VVKKLILIVDDDQGIRDALSELLEMEGYQVQLATNGEEGLQCLRTMDPEPSLVLLDLMMPAVDGLEFRHRQITENIRTHIPVVLMSADGQIEQKRMKSGITDHLRKPMDISQVMDIVERHCH